MQSPSFGGVGEEKPKKMIITFATQKGGAGKPRLPLHLPIMYREYPKGRLRFMILTFKNHFTINGKKTKSQKIQKFIT